MSNANQHFLAPRTVAGFVPVDDVDREMLMREDTHPEINQDRRRSSDRKSEYACKDFRVSILVRFWEINGL